MTRRLRHLRLYLDTARHLRPGQILHRFTFRLARPRPDLRPAPLRRAFAADLVSPARRRASLVAADTFHFLNETRPLSRHGWDDPALAKLWRYNLHYFDDLSAEGAAARADLHAALIARWIAENPPAGGTGWEPYPTSLRLVNWIKWLRAGHAAPEGMEQSLAVQARWLSRRLERHLLGNHLFANAKALVFAGCHFEGAEAERWFRTGMDILAREIPEQVLPDGAQFELSPMYHALALEDLLDLVNLLRVAGRAVPPDWAGRIMAMRGWLAAMCHPDGEIGFFNDAAMGIAPSPGEIEAFAARLGFAPLPPPPDPSCVWLEASGYLRLASGPAVALIDVARIGPDYLPGHAHADTLSFELSLRGQRVLVNSGTSVYGTGSERLRQRGTGAHNTVCVDGHDSSEVWSGFRVARRARPVGLSLARKPADGASDQGSVIVTCGHDGYRRLPGRPTHVRTFLWRAGGLAICDRIEGPHRSATAAFHFHPDVTLSVAQDGASGEATLAGVPLLTFRIAKGAGRVEPSTWHPEFGRVQPASRLLVSLMEGESMVELRWDRHGAAG